MFNECIDYDIYFKNSRIFVKNHCFAMKPQAGLSIENYAQLAIARAMQAILGLGGSISHSRRIWTLRVIAGGLLMCFGVIFSHPNMLSLSSSILPGMAYALLAGGAMIAVGFLTRVASLALAVMLVVGMVHTGLGDMMGMAEAACCGFCLFSFTLGSGRLSVDTSLFRYLLAARKIKRN